MSFKKVMEILLKLFSTLDKDPDERYMECQKVKKLLSCIQTPDVELLLQKSVIALQYAENFAGACNYFSVQVSWLHSGAQLENCRYKKRNVSVMYGCSSRDGRCGHGRGCFGGHGRFGGLGRGGHSGGGSGGGCRRGNVINGVNVSDPTCQFLHEEWNQLSYNNGWQ